MKLSWLINCFWTALFLPVTAVIEYTNQGVVHNEYPLLFNLINFENGKQHTHNRSKSIY
jgi:hypothetical protein